MEKSGISVGTFLRYRRRQRSWTLAQIAQKAGISKSTVSKWENGNVLPRLPELIVVMGILEVSTSERVAVLQQLGLCKFSPTTTDTQTLAPFA